MNDPRIILSFLQEVLHVEHHLLIDRALRSARRRQQTSGFEQGGGLRHARDDQAVVGDDVSIRHHPLIKKLTICLSIKSC